jgi:hypothetical protein
VTGSKRSFAEKAIATKLANLRSSAKLTHFLYDKVKFINKMYIPHRLSLQSESCLEEDAG